MPIKQANAARYPENWPALRSYLSVVVAEPVFVPKSVGVKSELSKIACNLCWKLTDDGGLRAGGCCLGALGGATTIPTSSNFGGGVAQLGSIKLSAQSVSS